MIRRVTAALATLAIGASIGAGAAVAGGNAWITDEVPTSETVASGCVIRFSNADGTPSIHANGAHQCAGVKSVEISQHGEIRVWQTVDSPAENPILFAMCQTDETLGGKRGITCGASGGTDKTNFRLYDTKLGRSLDLTKKADRMRVQGANSNLWVGWLHTENSR